MAALEIVKSYYSSFNQKNWDGMLALLHPEVRHEPNQGNVRVGIEKFTEFMGTMDDSYEENLTDMVYFATPDDSRVAVEFTVNGIYKKSEEGMPEAYGQSYQLPAAAFLELKEGKISRVTTYYNLPLWIELVSKPKND
jgi:steroid delta-isomerase-like uncharacterized protein